MFGCGQGIDLPGLVYDVPVDVVKIGQNVILVRVDIFLPFVTVNFLSSDHCWFNRIPGEDAATSKP